MENRSCYISCYATEQPASQPASQSAALVWGERRNTNANSALCTVNWPHITAAHFSSVCFLGLPVFPRFPALSVISHPLYVSDETGLCAVYWLKQREVMQCVNSPSGCRWFYASLLPLSDRFLSNFPLVSRRGSLPVWFCVSLWSEKGLFKFPQRVSNCILAISFWEIFLQIF